MKLIKLLSKTMLCCLLFSAIMACEKQPKEVVVQQWELVKNISNRKFCNACVVDGNLILMSLDSVVSFDKNLQQIKSHFIDSKKDGNFVAPYAFDNQGIIAMPVYANHAGRLDSLGIYFYNVKNNSKIIFDYSEIPQTDINGYVATDMMSNYGNKFSIVLERFDRNYIYPESNGNTSYKVLNINFSDVENLNYSVENLINFVDYAKIPRYNRHIHRIFLSYKDKYYVSNALNALYGTYIVDKNGFTEEHNVFYFLNSDTIYRISNQYLQESNDGITWTYKTTFDDEYFWNIEHKAKIFGNYVIRFEYAGLLGKADMLTGKTELSNANGLQNEFCDFFVEYNDYFYLGICGNIYRIKKNEIIK